MAFAELDVISLVLALIVSRACVYIFLVCNHIWENHFFDICDSSLQGLQKMYSGIVYCLAETWRVFQPNLSQTQWS